MAAVVAQSELPTPLQTNLPAQAGSFAETYVSFPQLPEEEEEEEEEHEETGGDANSNMRATGSETQSDADEGKSHACSSSSAPNSLPSSAGSGSSRRRNLSGLMMHGLRQMFGGGPSRPDFSDSSGMESVDEREPRGMCGHSWLDECRCPKLLKRGQGVVMCNRCASGRCSAAQHESPSGRQRR
jgi:hypothetical protein